MQLNFLTYELVETRKLEYNRLKCVDHDCRLFKCISWFSHYAMHIALLSDNFQLVLWSS